MSALDTDADPVGSAIWAVRLAHPDRFRIRFSGGSDALDTTVVVASPDEVPDGAVLCPEQAGKAERCGTCAVCWQSTVPVAFLAH